MNSPDFFNTVKTITTSDPLAKALGTFTDGIIEYNYTEIVKASGHSCPTVAGAYLITAIALENLYPNELPVRGMVRVELPEARTEGVTGVIANVIGHITGATEDNGFKGIGCNFSRINLLEYSKDIGCSAKFTRIDTGESVKVHYNSNKVPAHAELQPLMQRVLSGQATQNEIEQFGSMWQERVSKILLKSEEYNIIECVKTA